MVYISAKQLNEKFRACPAGVEAFKAEYPKGFRREWTLEEQLRVLQHTELRRYLGWAWRNKVVPQWSMRETDLSKANLTKADLYGADLTKANLPEANLTWANLSGTNLTGANLSKADLSGANLSGAYLTGANLTGANLIGASLFRVNLSGANLTGANLTGAIWGEREPPAGWRVNQEGRLESQPLNEGEKE